jgi:hypothetical protein
LLPGPGLKNARLERQAVLQRWPVKEDYREALINRQIAIAIDPTSTAKEATIAFRAVLAADLANMEQERREARIPDYHQLLHNGSVSLEGRREFFVDLGEALNEYPEAKMRVGMILDQCVRGNVGNGQESSGGFAP